MDRDLRVNLSVSLCLCGLLLFATKSEQRINPQRALGGQKRRGSSNRSQNCRNNGEDQWVRRAGAEKLTCEQIPEGIADAVSDYGIFNVREISAYSSKICMPEKVKQ